MKKLLFSAERLLYKTPEGAPNLPDTINEVQRRLHDPERARTLTADNVEQTLRDLDEFSENLDKGESDALTKLDERLKKQLDKGEIDTFERDEQMESLKAEYAKLKEKVGKYREDFEEVLDTIKEQTKGVLTERGRKFLTELEQMELSDAHQNLVGRYGELANETESFSIGGSCGEAVAELMDEVRTLSAPDSNWTMGKYENYDNRLTQFEAKMRELAQSGEAALLEYRANETNYQEYAGKNGKVRAVLNSEWTKEYPELRAEMEKLAKELEELGEPDENQTIVEEQEMYQMRLAAILGDFKIAFEEQNIERNRREAYAKAKASHDWANQRLMGISIGSAEVPEGYKTAVKDAAGGLEKMGELKETASAEESLAYLAKVEEAMDKFNREFALNEKAYEEAKSQYEVVKKAYDMASVEYIEFQAKMFNEALFGNAKTVKEYQVELAKLGVPKEPKLGGTASASVYETYVRDLKGIEAKFQLAVRAEELKKVGATKIAELLNKIKENGELPTLEEISKCESEDLRNIVYNTQIENHENLKRALGGVVGEMILLVRAKKAGDKMLAQLKQMEEGLTGVSEFVKHVDKAAAEYAASQVIGEYQEPAPKPERDIAAEMDLPDQSIMPEIPERPDMANIDNADIRARMQETFKEQARKEEELAKKTAERRKIAQARRKKEKAKPKSETEFSDLGKQIIKGHETLSNNDLLGRIDKGMEKALAQGDKKEYERLNGLRQQVREDILRRKHGTGGAFAGGGGEVPGN